MTRFARRGASYALAFSLVALVAAPDARADAARVDFNFQVRPILADRCFLCHGPDEKNRQAGLRLDQQESATAIREAATGRRAIAPGDPAKSQVVERIMATDPDVRMPPR